VIHEGNPFAPTEDDPFRRFRGRLAAPVTIITSGDDAKRTGLTVSSLFLVEGDPSLIHAVVGPNSDLFDVVAESGRFVVHICQGGQSSAADVFAGLRPSPGGLFKSVEWEQSDWGPVLGAMPNRAFCSLVSVEETAWSGVLVGHVDKFEIAELSSPLVHYRGSYRSLD
jgi:flavin reductase (DIM6/NTAB) family NADH-FMN oxidoreductase RutF